MKRSYALGTTASKPWHDLPPHNTSPPRLHSHGGATRAVITAAARTLPWGYGAKGIKLGDGENATWEYRRGAS